MFEYIQVLRTFEDHEIFGFVDWFFIFSQKRDKITEFSYLKRAPVLTLFNTTVTVLASESRPE